MVGATIHLIGHGALGNSHTRLRDSERSMEPGQKATPSIKTICRPHQTPEQPRPSRPYLTRRGSRSDATRILEIRGADAAFPGVACSARAALTALSGFDVGLSSVAATPAAFATAADDVPTGVDVPELATATADRAASRTSSLADAGMVHSTIARPVTPASRRIRRGQLGMMKAPFESNEMFGTAIYHRDG